MKHLDDWMWEHAFGEHRKDWVWFYLWLRHPHVRRLSREGKRLRKD